LINSNESDVTVWQSAIVDAGVARTAKRNQVFFRISAGLAAELLVVNLKIRHAAAGLASPNIAV
jgi:hypothetical protein